MSTYRICEECGAALDPGERCDCLSVAPPKLIQPEESQVGSDALRSVVASAPAGVEFAPEEIEEDPFRDPMSVRVESGIETFREPVGFLYSTKNFNWFGFLSGGVLVYQGFPKEGE